MNQRGLDAMFIIMFLLWGAGLGAHVWHNRRAGWREIVWSSNPLQVRARACVLV